MAGKIAFGFDFLNSSTTVGEMSVAKSLTKDQIAEIQTWADDGLGLSDIQRRLGDEMDVKVTYMEVRFLVEDIGIEFPPPPVVEPEPEPEPAPEEFSEIAPSDGEAPAATDAPAAEAPMAVISIDEDPREGSMVSGVVAFEGGKTLTWFLDDLGRMGVEPGIDPEFQPTEAQVTAFQSELKVALKDKGIG